MKACVRSIALMLAGVAFLGSASSQEKAIKKEDVPKEVMNSFKTSYPNASMKGYSREIEKGSTTYEIESTEGQVHRDVTYTSDGILVSVEESLSCPDLPAAVRKSISTSYPKGQLDLCEKIVKSSMVQYEVVVKSGKKKYELVLNADGTVVETETK